MQIIGGDFFGGGFEGILIGEGFEGTLIGEGFEGTDLATLSHLECLALPWAS